MRLTLIDLIVLGGLFFAGAALCAPAALFVRPLVIVPFAALSGTAILLGLGSPLYRRLHFRPMFVPVCPHCHRRPIGYEILGGSWPLEVIRCGSCSGVTQLWYDSGAPPAELARRAPVAQSKWPFVLGRWQVLERAGVRGTDEPNPARDRPNTKASPGA